MRRVGVFAALAIAALMMFVYYRARDFRQAAEQQAEQNERNQQAILRLLDELSSLADGDLTVQATVTEDITGAIADSINYAIEALRELVATINDSSIHVDAATVRPLPSMTFLTTRSVASLLGRTVSSTVRTDVAFGPHTDLSKSLVSFSSSAADFQVPASEGGVADA